MRSDNPWFSPLSFVVTALIFAGLLLAVRRRGHLIFSPGELTARAAPETLIGGYASHAEFEKECRSCHQPLRVAQADLCVACHSTVTEQLAAMDGIHGKIPDIAACAACHPDHRGRDFDPNSTARERYDHGYTSFSLVHHQIDYDTTPIACEQCHAGSDYSLSNEPCQACHQAENPVYLNQHLAEMGADCLACHDGQDRMRGFDHNSTGFPLEYGHAQISCTTCHTREPFQAAAADCLACHDRPAVHYNLFAAACEDCHRTDSWSPAQLDGESFSHETATRFSLRKHASDYAGKPLDCAGCHPNELHQFDLADCVACHQQEDQEFMARHQADFGPGCLACHDGTDRMDGFDHDSVFVLDGRHQEISCLDCHQDYTWPGIPSACVACHEEPEIHLGTFGLQCEYCHTAQAWTPAQLRLHPFPLDHGEPPEPSDCTLCHETTYARHTCFTCHEHEPAEIERSHLDAGLAPDEISNCIICHPTGTTEEATR